MPFKNRADLIGETIDSVLSQTWTDFELICISDGSTDESDEIVRDYAAKDARVSLVSNENKPGISGAANTGLAHARGEFVARIDSDDIMLQNRIAVQVRFMDEHPEVAVCGSWVQTFGEVDGTIWRLPVSHEEICVWMLFHGALAHPAVIIRRQSVCGNRTAPRGNLQCGGRLRAMDEGRTQGSAGECSAHPAALSNAFGQPVHD